MERDLRARFQCFEKEMKMSATNKNKMIRSSTAEFLTFVAAGVAGVIAGVSPVIS